MLILMYFLLSAYILAAFAALIAWVWLAIIGIIDDVVATRRERRHKNDDSDCT